MAGKGSLPRDRNDARGGGRHLCCCEAAVGPGGPRQLRLRDRCPETGAAAVGARLAVRPLQAAHRVLLRVLSLTSKHEPLTVNIARLPPDPL